MNVLDYETFPVYEIFELPEMFPFYICEFITQGVEIPSEVQTTLVNNLHAILFIRAKQDSFLWVQKGEYFY